MQITTQIPKTRNYFIRLQGTMMKPFEVDYIIVGQGLAGSAVALQLLKRDKSILVIDRITPNTPSRVAVGLFNPITGRHSIKTWFADQLFPYFHKFYKEAEVLTNHRCFYYPAPLYKPFASIEEQNEWMSKSPDPGYSGYVESINTRPAFSFVKDQFGGMILNQCGYLDTIAYLGAVRGLIRARGTLLEETFEERLLIPGHEEIHYRNYTSAHIIFCQGLDAGEWFKWVPVLPLKGETIRVQSDHSQNIIVNRGVYVVPANQKGTWRVGATYSLRIAPTVLQNKRVQNNLQIERTVSFSYELLVRWGNRPTTHDVVRYRQSPCYHRMHIFNAGPEGLSLAPYFSDILVKSLKMAIVKQDVSLERYKSLYWSPSHDYDCAAELYYHFNNP